MSKKMLEEHRVSAVTMRTDFGFKYRSNEKHTHFPSPTQDTHTQKKSWCENKRTQFIVASLRYYCASPSMNQAHMRCFIQQLHCYRTINARHSACKVGLYDFHGNVSQIWAFLPKISLVPCGSRYVYKLEHLKSSQFPSNMYKLEQLCSWILLFFSRVYKLEENRTGFRS
jgi:hypothetical protein